MNYTLNKYGKEYSIFCNQSRCYVLFFKTKKEALKRISELNKI